MLLLALGRVGLGPEGRLIPYEIADERFKALWGGVLCGRYHVVPGCVGVEADRRYCCAQDGRRRRRMIRDPLSNKRLLPTR